MRGWATVKVMVEEKLTGDFYGAFGRAKVVRGDAGVVVEQLLADVLDAQDGHSLLLGHFVVGRAPDLFAASLLPRDLGLALGHEAARNLNALVLFVVQVHPLHGHVDVGTAFIVDGDVLDGVGFVAVACSARVHSGVLASRIADLEHAIVHERAEVHVRAFLGVGDVGLRGRRRAAVNGDRSTFFGLELVHVRFDGRGAYGGRNQTKEKGGNVNPSVVSRTESTDVHRRLRLDTVSRLGTDFGRGNAGNYVEKTREEMLTQQLDAVDEGTFVLVAQTAHKLSGSFGADYSNLEVVLVEVEVISPEQGGVVDEEDGLFEEPQPQHGF